MSRKYKTIIPHGCAGAKPRCQTCLHPRGHRLYNVGKLTSGGLLGPIKKPSCGCECHG